MVKESHNKAVDDAIKYVLVEEMRQLMNESKLFLNTEKDNG